MMLVILESPFAAPSYTEVALNIAYARACMRDCLMRGEAPYASHLLYTQPGVLDDEVPEERALGIEAGLRWGKMASKSVVYVDRGVSRGMRMGIERAEAEGREVEYRWLIEPEFVPRTSSPILPPPSFSLEDTKPIQQTLNIPTPSVPRPTFGAVVGRGPVETVIDSLLRGRSGR